MLDNLVKYRKNIKMIAYIVAAITFIIDVVFSGQPIVPKLILYFAILIMCILIWFGVYLMLWFPPCPPKISNFFVKILVVFSIIVILSGLSDFITDFRSDEYINMVIPMLALLLTIIRFQCKKENKKF